MMHMCPAGYCAELLPLALGLSGGAASSRLGLSDAQLLIGTVSSSSVLPCSSVISTMASSPEVSTTVPEVPTGHFPRASPSSTTSNGSGLPLISSRLCGPARDAFRAASRGYRPTGGREESQPFRANVQRGSDRLRGVVASDPKRREAGLGSGHRFRVPRRVGVASRKRDSRR